VKIENGTGAGKTGTEKSLEKAIKTPKAIQNP